MRLSPIAPSELTQDQQPLFEEMRQGVAAGFAAFETTNADGALLGPWSVWLHDPDIGQAFWGVTKALGRNKRLPDPARQVAILVVGSRFKARYELYAHSAVALKVHGMPAERLSCLLAGAKPADLDEQEAAAFDVATSLLQGGVLPGAIYARALAVFGQPGLNELIFLVGHYSLISVVLNGFDVSAPDESPPA